MNRPEVPEHSVSIAKYIKENKERRYILPPLTLNIKDETNLYTTKAPGAKVKTGYLVINPTSKLAITDGQHRRTAIEEVVREMPDLANDAIGVMITCENRVVPNPSRFRGLQQDQAPPPQPARGLQTCGIPRIASSLRLRRNARSSTERSMQRAKRSASTQRSFFWRTTFGNS